MEDEGDEMFILVADPGPQLGGKQMETHGDNQRRRERAEEKIDECEQQQQQQLQQQQQQQQSGQEFEKVIDQSPRCLLPDTRDLPRECQGPSGATSPPTLTLPLVDLRPPPLIPFYKYFASGCFDEHGMPIPPVKGVVGMTRVPSFAPT